MFRRIALIVLVVGLTLSLAVTPAAAKTITFHSKIQGLSALAIFSSFDETGCIETVVALSAQDNRRKEEGRPYGESIAIVNVYQFNHCTGENLLSTFGFTTLAPDEFVIDKKLNQATLTTTIVVQDSVTEGLTFPVDINVTWTGVGETSTNKEHFQIKEPGFQLNLHSLGINRQAQASGTVTGLGINFTPEPATDANLANIKFGEVQIVHDV